MFRDSPARSLSNPQEEALHSFCKKVLKWRLFKGFYKERCYIDLVNGYRDLIVLDGSEYDLKVILGDIRNRLLQFYQTCSTPMWVGITETQNSQAEIGSDMCIWVELDEMAFNQYWFSIKTVKFRENEIIIKLKSVREVEVEHGILSSGISSADREKTHSDSITLQDFAQVVTGWGTSIKCTAYEFLSNDISKENLLAVLKFFFLVAISLLSSLIEAVKFVGIFTIRFMGEFRKLLIASTPILLRIVDLCGKVVGGFYILLAMIWRDTAGAKTQSNQPRAIAYKRIRAIR